MKHSKTDLEEGHSHHEIDDIYKINDNIDENQIGEDDHDNINEIEDTDDVDDDFYRYLF